MKLPDPLQYIVLDYAQIALYLKTDHNVDLSKDIDKGDMSIISIEAEKRYLLDYDLYFKPQLRRAIEILEWKYGTDKILIY